MSKRLQINVRLEGKQELYDAIKEEAHLRGMSMSAFIVHSLEKAVGMSPQQQQEIILSQEVFDFLEDKIEEVIDRKLSQKVEEVIDRKLSQVVFKAG